MAWEEGQLNHASSSEHYLMQIVQHLHFYCASQFGKVPTDKLTDYKLKFEYIPEELSRQQEEQKKKQLAERSKQAWMGLVKKEKDIQ